MKIFSRISYIILSTLLVSAFLLTSGCRDRSLPAPSVKEAKKVSIALLRLSSSAPIFIGIEKGFFQEEGIDLKPEWFDAAQPIAVATASNKVDVGATGITAGLYNMVAQGQKITIVADKGREEKGVLSTALMVNSSAYNDGIKDIISLKGKTVGITQSGSTFDYMIGRVLESHGLSRSDVNLIPLGKLSSVLSALESKQIDAAILNQPHISKAEEAGYAKVLLSIGDIIPYQTSGIFFSPSFLKDKDTALAFMRAYIKSSTYYYDAALTKEKGKQYDEVLQIISKYTNAPVSTVAKGLPYMDRTGKLLAEDIQTQIDWYYKEGLLIKPIKAEEIIDMTFWEKASAGK